MIIFMSACPACHEDADMMTIVLLTLTKEKQEKRKKKKERNDDAMRKPFDSWSLVGKLAFLSLFLSLKRAHSHTRTLTKHTFSLFRSCTHQFTHILFHSSNNNNNYTHHTHPHTPSPSLIVSHQILLVNILGFKPVNETTTHGKKCVSFVSAVSGLRKKKTFFFLGYLALAVAGTGVFFLSVLF